MTHPNLTNLFEESCDPHAYIPRRATEEVLKCVSSLVRDSEPVVVLHGPAGIGKSMLMQVLKERFDGERRVAYASLGDTGEDDLQARLLDELSEPKSDDPEQALIRAASDSPTKLLLLIDHPNLAPVGASLQLASIAKSATPYLTVVFAIADDVGAQQFARALSVEASVTTLGFDQPMDSKEASAYVRLRLARTELPASLRDQLDERAMSWLTEGAQAGLPREINRRASELLQSFEEGGEDALRIPVEASSSMAEEDVEQPVAAPRAVDPSTHGAGSMIDPQPPPFPMQSGDAPDPASAGPVGGGSLGGMLLRSGPGAKPNFEMNLELGRSLSSGLLESATARPSSKDGQPVSPEEAAAAAAAHPAARGPAAAQALNGRRPVFLVAASVAAFVIGGVYVATRDEPAPETTTTTTTTSPKESLDVDSIRPAVVPDATTDLPDESVAETPGLAAPDPAAIETDVRPKLADGPMHDAALLAVKASSKKPAVEPDDADAEPDVVAALAPAVPVRSTPQPARVAEPQPKVRPSNAPIVLPARPAGAGAPQANAYVRLSIDVEPGAEISIDGESIGVAPLSEIFIEMGTHIFVAELPDGLRVEQLVDVQDGTDVVEF